MEGVTQTETQSLLQAVEITAVVDEKHNLLLDAPLPAGLSGRVRVIVITQPEANDKTAPANYDTSEITDEEWHRAVSVWQAEDLVDEPDIYTWEDGQPFHPSEK